MAYQGQPIVEGNGAVGFASGSLALKRCSAEPHELELVLDGEFFEFKRLGFLRLE